MLWGTQSYSLNIVSTRGPSHKRNDPCGAFGSLVVAAIPEFYLARLRRRHFVRIREDDDPSEWQDQQARWRHKAITFWVCSWSWVAFTIVFLVIFNSSIARKSSTAWSMGVITLAVEGLNIAYKLKIINSER